jgi:hypothetical protein
MDIFFGEKINYVKQQSKGYVESMGSITGYNILITFVILFFLISTILVTYNSKGFNESLGYGFFITLIILLIVSVLLRKYNIDEINKNLGETAGLMDKINNIFNSFGTLETIGVVFVLGALFMGLLASLGLFQKNIPSNNKAALLNYFIMMMFFGIFYYFFKKGREVDAKLIPENLQLFYNEKMKYTIIFILFIVFVIGLYLLNPYEIMSKYGGASVFFLLFIGVILFAMIRLNSYFFDNPQYSGTYKDAPGIISFLKVGYVLAALFISGMFLWGLLYVLGVFRNDADNPYSLRHIVVNLVLLVSMLGILYKLANAGGFLAKNPYFRLVLNIILYVPCLLVVITDYLSKFVFSATTNIQQSKNDYVFLGLAVLLSASYLFFNSFFFPFVKKQYYNLGGKTLIREPIPINMTTNIDSISQLNDYTNPNKLNYTYALSFWYYIDALPPNTNSSYQKNTNILACGDNIYVKYYSPSNTLYITVKETQGTTDKMHELDEDGYRIVYKKQDVLLQKWNNIVLNYNGGTLDIFYNGKLEKSAINVVPTNKGVGQDNSEPGNDEDNVINDMLTVGTTNGISGQMANITFFKEPIDYLTINKLYVLFKDKTPPLE